MHVTYLSYKLFHNSTKFISARFVILGFSQLKSAKLKLSQLSFNSIHFVISSASASACMLATHPSPCRA